MGFLSSLSRYFFILAELSLILRIVLKFLAASSEALIVNLLYKVTDFIIIPFDFIFPNIFLDADKIIDIVAITSAIGYLLLVAIIVKFINLIRSKG